MIEKIKQHFADHITVSQQFSTDALESIAQAGQMIVAALLADHKILSCANGDASYLSPYFCSQLLNRFERQRPSLPAIALASDSISFCAIAADDGYDQVFARPLRALAQTGDVLLAISNGKHHDSIYQAINIAQQRNIAVIALTGSDNDDISALLQDDKDCQICCPTTTNIRIQESHLLVIHCLCDIIDHQLFG